MLNGRQRGVHAGDVKELLIYGGGGRARAGKIWCRQERTLQKNNLSAICCPGMVCHPRMVAGTMAVF
jgi:hypothetical protein